MENILFRMGKVSIKKSMVAMYRRIQQNLNGEKVFPEVDEDGKFGRE